MISRYSPIPCWRAQPSPLARTEIGRVHQSVKVSAETLNHSQKKRPHIHMPISTASSLHTSRHSSRHASSRLGGGVIPSVATVPGTASADLAITDASPLPPLPTSPSRTRPQCCALYPHRPAVVLAVVPVAVAVFWAIVPAACSLGLPYPPSSSSW
jgi:hypothetical protein